MTTNTPRRKDEPDEGSRPRRARIPGFDADTEVGLGDVVKRATTFMGIRPCAPCDRRAERLNSWIRFVGR